MPDPEPTIPEWARPEPSFPYFPVGVIGSGFGWAALSLFNQLFPAPSQNPFLGWVGLLLFALVFAFLAGVAVHLVRRGLGKKGGFDAQTCLVLFGGGVVGAVIIGVMLAVSGKLG